MATDANGFVRYLNPIAEQLTGWGLEEAIGKPVEQVFELTNLFGERIVPCQLRRVIASAAETGKERFLLRGRDGRVIPIEDSASPILERGRIAGAISVFLDISDRIRQEQEQENEIVRLEGQVQTTTDALGPYSGRTSRLVGPSDDRPGRGTEACRTRATRRPRPASLIS